MATVTRHDLLGYRELETATGVPGSTLRRYAKRFPSFLPCRVVDRAARFQPDAVDVFQRIHALYTAGRRTDEVAEILAAEVPQVHDVATPATTVATVGDPVALAALLPMVERLTLAVETLAEAQAETVALLKEMREKPRERAVDASGDGSQGKDHGKGNAPQMPLWSLLWVRWFWW